MKRRDIKNTTIYIIIFCVLSFILIIILAPKSVRNQSASRTADGKKILWSDTISNSSSDINELKDMENEILRFMSKWDIKGMSIAVSRNDSLLYVKGLGYADLEKLEPMNANSVMRIASVSKLVTATAIMKLVESGKLNLNEKVFGADGILNDAGFTESIRDERIYNITVEDLLHHKGGFTLGAGDPMFNTAEIIKAKKLDGAPSEDELIKIVLNRRLGFHPGAGKRYSNFGYMLLSKIIEKKSGKSYWDYVTEKVLNPSGCYAFKPATNYYEEKYPMEVKYYSPDNELVEEFNGSGRMVDRCYGGANINGLKGAGGWITSAADLIRFVAYIDGIGVKKDILSAESVRLMTAYEENGDKQCFGWTDSDGKGKLMRSGTLSSAHALIEKFPDNECWVITMNSGVWRGYHFTREMQRLIEKLRIKYSQKFPARDLF